MDDQENPLSTWFAETAVGRTVLGAKDSLDRIYYRHVDRYHQASEGGYRLCTRLGVISFVLVGAVAAFFIIQPNYRHYQEHRGAREAEAYLAREDYRNALLCARRVLQLNGSNVPACRVMARLADISHAPQTLAWLQRIAAAEPTLENKLLLAAAGLRYQSPPFPLTAETLAGLPPTAATNLTYQLVAASFALERNQLAEAENHFAIAARMDPTNQNNVLNLAILRLGMTNETMQAFSRATLAKLSADTNLGPSALRAMIADRLRHNDLAAAGKLSGELLVGGRASLADQLQNLDILQQLTNGMFSSRLEAVKDQAATNAAEAGEMAGWMQSHGLITNTINWLTNLDETVRVEQPVELATASAYFMSGNWRGLRDFASEGNWKSMEFLRFALVSHACAEMGMYDVAAGNWNAAVNEVILGAQGSYAASVRLTELATDWHMAREREELLSRMIDRFPKEHWPATALVEFYFSQGRTADLNQLSARLLVLHPGEIAFENNLAATALLLKTNLSQAYTLAASAYTNAPGDPSEATTYAYALHLQGRDRDGLALLQKLPPARLNDPSIALYYGLLLDAVGKHADALPWLQLARGYNHLLPEEKQLLAAILNADSIR